MLARGKVEIMKLIRVKTTRIDQLE